MDYRPLDHFTLQPHRDGPPVRMIDVGRRAEQSYLLGRAVRLFAVIVATSGFTTSPLARPRRLPGRRRGVHLPQT
jgi:hypothetical protein